MSRVNNRSALERFVFSYLNKLKFANNLRAERPYLIKAIVLIDAYLGDACCIDPQAVRAYGTRRDNFFTHTIRGILNQEPLRRTIRKSFENAKLLITRKLYNICCYDPIEIITNNFTCGGADPVVLTLVGQEGQGTYTLNLPAPENPIYLSLPLIGKYRISLSGPTVVIPAQVQFRDSNEEELFAITVTPDEPFDSFIADMSGAASIFANCQPVPATPVFRWPSTAQAQLYTVGNNRVSQVVFFAEDGEFPVTYNVTGVPAFGAVTTGTHGIYKYAIVTLTPVDSGSNGVYVMEATATSGEFTSTKQITVTVIDGNTTRYVRPFANSGIINGQVGVDIDTYITNLQTPSSNGIQVFSFPALSDTWGGGSLGTSVLITGTPQTSDIGNHLYFGAIASGGLFRDTLQVKITVTP